jgi:hypothetical protein
MESLSVGSIDAGRFFFVWAGFPFCFFFRALSLLFSASMIDRKGAGAVEQNLF